MTKEYSPKEKAIYNAVIELFEDGADLNNITVAEITKKAGIGKGTAYEYFSDKEEMIAKAIFYNGETFCSQICEGICKEKELHNKVNYVLIKMEQHMPKANCIFRIMYMMSDTSTIGKKMQEMVKDALSMKMSAMSIVKGVLEDEFKDRETPSDDKMKYLMLSIYSKILCYSMLLSNGQYKQESERSVIREMVNEGICREIREI